MLTHVVWDWNGTLLDDVDCCVTVANDLLSEFGLPQLEGLADYRATFRFPIVEYYADLGFDTGPGGNFVQAAHRYMELYGQASTVCGLHEGARETLELLHRAGVRQVVISASRQDNLVAQMAPFGLEALLDGVHGIEDIYAASKEGLARRWLEESGATASQVLFVGDSPHDAEIAQALGAECVLYGGGHHAQAYLETLGPRVVDDLRDVAALVAAS